MASLFQGPLQPRRYQGGASSISVNQVPPNPRATGRLGTVITGDTIFNVSPGARFLLPSECYFRVRIQINTAAAAVSPTAQRLLTYAENWPNTLFSAIRISCNGQPIEESLYPVVSDQLATIAAGRRGWLKGYASSAGV